jgi:hypothetical protein
MADILGEAEKAYNSSKGESNSSSAKRTGGNRVNRE